MEGNTRLVQIIREMRSEINNLERENRALRVELKFSGLRTTTQATGARGKGGQGEARSLTDSGEETVTSPVALSRNVSASSTLTLQEQKGTSMIVRRYSSSSSVQSFSGHKHHKAEKRHLSNGIMAVQGIVKPPASSSVMQIANEEEKGCAEIPAHCFSSNNSSKRRSFQEHVYKCRGKVKAVSFLLPMDMSSYSENQGSFKCPQNQDTKQLSTIIEKDM
ncbi:coiled-coil domain-containing protein 195 [Pelodiscus sinensis]|uniref:coiled-coil domain-containing protein 195 n=1 Tax=Pelodiscus sinensis TaxID=13735 RepID=UPI000D7200AD|nr:putative coiled-coil domain-containing protein 195 [Pelodiscus sinensis]|eukprot:XP_025044622.1 putative coiled-coil domain-containing protein 195 [Pelodiscus sinensis]